MGIGNLHHTHTSNPVVYTDQPRFICPLFSSLASFCRQKHIRSFLDVNHLMPSCVYLIKYLPQEAILGHLLYSLPLPSALQTPCRVHPNTYSTLVTHLFALPFFPLCAEILEDRSVSYSLQILIADCSPEHTVGVQ